MGGKDESHVTEAALLAVSAAKPQEWTTQRTSDAWSKLSCATTGEYEHTAGKATDGQSGVDPLRQQPMAWAA